MPELELVNLGLPVSEFYPLFFRDLRLVETILLGPERRAEGGLMPPPTCGGVKKDYASRLWPKGIDGKTSLICVCEASDKRARKKGVSERV